MPTVGCVMSAPAQPTADTGTPSLSRYILAPHPEPSREPPGPQRTSAPLIDTLGTDGLSFRMLLTAGGVTEDSSSIPVKQYPPKDLEPSSGTSKTGPLKGLPAKPPASGKAP